MIGLRTRGAKGGRFLFAARSWVGTVPDDVTELIRSESDVVKVKGRIRTDDVPGDLEIASECMDRWKLEILLDHLATDRPPETTRAYPDPAATTFVDHGIGLEVARPSHGDAGVVPRPNGRDGPRTFITSSADVRPQPGAGAALDS